MLAWYDLQRQDKKYVKTHEPSPAYLEGKGFMGREAQEVCWEGIFSELRSGNLDGVMCGWKWRVLGRVFGAEGSAWPEVLKLEGMRCSGECRTPLALRHACLQSRV